MSPAPALAKAGAVHAPPPTHTAPQVRAVSTHTTQETRVQVRISDKTNEIPVAQDLLPPLALRGRVVTADALHTHTALAPCILAHGAAYLFTVTDNQPRERRIGRLLCRPTRHHAYRPAQ